MLRIPIPSSSAYITESGILVASATSYFWPDSGIKPRLIFMSHKGDALLELSDFSSGKNLLLHVSNDSTFLGLDNKLLLSHDLRKWRTVLTAKSSNTFWHMAEAVDGTLFVHTMVSVVAQEYTGQRMAVKLGSRLLNAINSIKGRYISIALHMTSFEDF